MISSKNKNKSKSKNNAHADILSILPQFKLSNISRSVIKKIWLGIKTPKNWKKYIVSNEAYSFNPARDMNDMKNNNLNSLGGEIAQTIASNANSQCRKISLNFPSKDGNKMINVYIVWYPESVPPNVDEMVRRIVAWFRFIIQFARSPTCSSHVDVFIVLTSHLSLIPQDGDCFSGEMLDTFSAYTYVCRPKNEMYILRQSVWFKALIHESFHTFGIDFGQFNYPTRNIRNAFPGVENAEEMLLYEAYTDIWATICYTLFSVQKNATYNSYSIKPRHVHRSHTRTLRSLPVQNIPYLAIEKGLHKQCCFAMFQCAKMLKCMGASLEDILSRTGVKKYDKVHIFNYHLARPCYMIDLNRFIEWTNAHNSADKYLMFSENELNAQSFVDMLSVNASNPQFVKYYKNAQEVFLKMDKTDYLYNTAILSYPME